MLFEGKQLFLSLCFFLYFFVVSFWKQTRNKQNENPFPTKQHPSCFALQQKSIISSFLFPNVVLFSFFCYTSSVLLAYRCYVWSWTRTFHCVAGMCTMWSANSSKPIKFYLFAILVEKFFLFITSKNRWCFIAMPRIQVAIVIIACFFHIEGDWTIRTRLIFYFIAWIIIDWTLLISPLYEIFIGFVHEGFMLLQGVPDSILLFSLIIEREIINDYLSSKISLNHKSLRLFAHNFWHVFWLFYWNESCLGVFLKNEFS